jgi:hemolysin III
MALFCKLRDPVSGLTHLGGALLAVAGLALLLAESSSPAKPWHLVAFSVFGVAAIGLYVASTCYHLIPYGEKRTARLRKWDHIMIFFLIAGTYTPICLIPLRGPWGWSLFGVVWGLAVAGLVLKLFWMQAPRWLSTGTYVLMGWLVLVGVYPLVRAMQPGALAWLLAGGLFYTAGGVIYALKRPDPWPARFGFHEIFHILVMLGTFSHFWVMYRYVTQMG